MTSQGQSSTSNSSITTATAGTSSNGSWSRSKVTYCDSPLNSWWKRISEDPELFPQEQDGISKRRLEYRFAVEQNKFISEKLQFRNAQSLETAVDFLWTCNFGGDSPPDDVLLQSIHDETREDLGHSYYKALPLRIYRRTLAFTLYSNKTKCKILDNHLVWLLCQTLKADSRLPSHLPEILGSNTQWDGLWDITPFAHRVGSWNPMASHYSTTHMAQWIMECERCIFANKAPPSAQTATVMRRGKAVAVVEILVNLQKYIISNVNNKPRDPNFRTILFTFFSKHMPQDLWESAFPGCPRDESSLESTLARNMDLILAALGLLGDKTFEEAFKKWFLSDTTSQPGSARLGPPNQAFPDITVFGMFPSLLKDESKCYEFNPSALDAWFINSGRFKLKSTDDLRQHLRLDQSIRAVYVYIGSNSFENGRLALLHDSPIARGFALDHLWKELQMTYSLLFGQTALGKKIGRDMIAGTNPEYQWLPPMPATFRERKVLGRTGYLVYKATPDSEFTFEDWGTEKQMPGASSCPPVPGDFRYFGPRLELLHKQMLADQPRTYFDVFRPGYTDRFTWYTQMFAMFIAFLGVLNIILSLVQTAYTGVTYRDTKSLAVEANELAKQQLDASIAALNVSLQQLLLQKLQMNITTP